MTISVLNYVRRVLIVATMMWLAFIGFEAERRWPALPLDIDARDAAVKTAHQSAVQGHLFRAGELALGGLATALALWWLAKRSEANGTQ